MIAALAVLAAACGGSSSNTPPPPLAPVVSLPASLPFGNVAQGTTSAAMTATLTNTGTAPLSFTANPAISGTNAADFSIAAVTCSTANQVAANASCAVMITLKPSTAAAESATLTFVDNAANSPQTVALSGTGTAPAPVVTLPTTLPFSLVPKGTTSATLTVTLMNTGSASLTFTSTPTISGPNAADFNMAANTCVVATPVAPTGSCTVMITFTPSTTAAESATLSFADNAAGSPQTVTLTGTGTAPAVSVPTSLSFGSTGQGIASRTFSVTLTNTGNGALTFNPGPALSGANAADFSITNTTCSTASQVPGGGSCTVVLTLTASTLGMETASLNFTDNAPTSPQSVSLTGAGIIRNVQAAEVNFGPLDPQNGVVNTLFITITICAPNTNTCQDIPNVEVDTGSEGLRLLASAVNIPLTTATNGSGSPFGNCVQFADDSFAWGALQNADVILAGEVALAQPIQVIGVAGFPTVPSSCSTVMGMQGTPLTDVNSLGANGIIGLGVFRQDCGSFCVANAPTGEYYVCVGSTASSCTPTTMSLAGQLQNPVWNFPQDNNGMLVVLANADPSGDATVDGSLIFGVGTQANNPLGTATIYTTDDVGNYTVSSAVGTSSASFVDSGSNGFFFLTKAQTGISDCMVNGTDIGFYCPNTTTNFTATTTGANNATGMFSFSIANALTLFNDNPTFAAFINLGGPFPGSYDLGLPFFFGRNVFIGIEGQATGNVLGPYFAY
ncbi:MAG TPA: DUF3443 family protein [Candidatus Acidoferrales bacterium]|nr:DUF3443 family protein [Candidatus Acidoferrales bacterium]